MHSIFALQSQIEKKPSPKKTLSLFFHISKKSLSLFFHISKNSFTFLSLFFHFSFTFRFFQQKAVFLFIFFLLFFQKLSYFFFEYFIKNFSFFGFQFLNKKQDFRVTKCQKKKKCIFHLYFTILFLKNGIFHLSVYYLS